MGKFNKDKKKTIKKDDKRAATSPIFSKIDISKNNAIFLNEMRIKNIRKLVIGNLSIFCPSKHLTN